MKRFFVMMMAISGLMFFSVSTVFSQTDDVYYDSSTDSDYQQPANYSPSDNSSNSNSYTLPSTGNGSSADSYDQADNSMSYNDPNGNTYITNNYYGDDDWDDFSYTTRLRRFYGGYNDFGFYSYFYTPSYYWGWNNFNTGLYVSDMPWYADSWWGWNRPYYRPNVVVYNPFWSWNWGWSSCSYYNTWNNPWYSYRGGYGSYPYYGWRGRHNGYNQGFYDGYYNGYHNGYYGGGYGNNYNSWNGYYYQGPRHRNSTVQNTPVVNSSGSNGQTGGQVAPNHGINIPKEGIATPMKPKYYGNTVSPGSQKTIENKTEENLQNGNPKVDLKPNKSNGDWKKYNDPYSPDNKVNNAKPWNSPSIEPKNNSNSQPNEHGRYSNTERNSEQMKSYEQPRQYNQQPKQYEQPRQSNRQPKQFEQPKRYEQQRQFNQHPKHETENKHNTSPRQMERNYSPAPRGGSFKRGG